jgi:hypothetical protein
LKSDFAGISRDGRSVMFATNATLVSADQDGEGRDLYAARLGGGFPATEITRCDSVSCPLPAAERIVRPLPASLTPVPHKRRRLRVIDVAAKAKRGAVAVLVSASARGLVSGRIWTRKKGRKLVLAQGSSRAKRAGRIRLALRLTGPARRLAGDGPRRARLTVRDGSAKVSRVVKVRLR